MNILLAFNSNYFLPALVMLNSLLKNNRWCPEIVIYVMYLDLKEEEIRRFVQEAEKWGNARAEFIRVPEDAFADAPLHLKWISRETYFRLLAQEMLPQDVKRLLYLDVDLTIRGSLKEFYNQDMEGNLLVACCSHEAFKPDAHTLQQLTLPEDTIYFNAGVLLYDLEGQRREIDPAIYREYPVLFYKQLRYGDQDVLNAVFYGMTKLADYRVYNMFDYYVRRERDVERVRKHAVIFHYNGKGKPWMEQYWGKMAWLFWEYAMEIPEYRTQCQELTQKQAAFQKKRRAQLAAHTRKKNRERAAREKSEEAV